MAVAEMSKLNLVAMSYEKDKVLNALQRTGATEVKLHSQTEYAAPLNTDCGELRDYLAGLEETLKKLTEFAQKHISKNKLKSDLPEETFEITYSEFFAANGLKAEAEKTCEEVNRLFGEKKKISSELAKIEKTIAE